MHKIPLLFKRGAEGFVIPELNPAAAWVLEEPTIAHRKYDGTCMYFDGNCWLARRTVKKGKQPPENYTEVEFDNNTGHSFGWEPIEQAPFVKAWEDAIQKQPMDCDVLNLRDGAYETGTYELMGPKINGNPEKLKQHRLMPHSNAAQLGDIQQLEIDLAESVDVVYAELKQVLYYSPIEGVVFKDRKMEKMAKLRRKDFDYREEDFLANFQASPQG